MPIAVRCPACGQNHKVADRAAGRTLACLKCKTAMTVPQPAPAEPATPASSPAAAKPPKPVPAKPPAASLSSLLDDFPGLQTPAPHVEPPAPVFDDDVPGLDRADPQPLEFTFPSGRHTAAGAEQTLRLTPAAARQLPPVVSHELPLWRRHLHWLLVLALVPLVVLLLTQSQEKPFLDQLTERLEELTPDELAKLQPLLEDVDSQDMDALDILLALPDQRLTGALLARGSSTHWLMALAATIVYMAFFMFLASGGVAKPLHILATGLFTATIGITFLLLIQWLAETSRGYVLIGFSIVVLFFYIFRFIAFSYEAADDPDNGFVLSFLGYTLGVGLCEEFVKAMPVFFYRDSQKRLDLAGLDDRRPGLGSGLRHRRGNHVFQLLLQRNRWPGRLSGPISVLRGPARHLDRLGGDFAPLASRLVRRHRSLVRVAAALADRPGHSRRAAWAVRYLPEKGIEWLCARGRVCQFRLAGVSAQPPADRRRQGGPQNDAAGLRPPSLGDYVTRSSFRRDFAAGIAARRCLLGHSGDWHV